MKKLGAILFGIVFMLGLSIETTSAQQVEIVNFDGVVSSGYWNPTPTADILNDWDNTDPGPDGSSTAAQDEYDSLTVDFQDPTGGPYTAINVKIRASSDSYGDELSVGIYAVGINAEVIEIGDFYVTPDSSFQEYSHEFTGLHMTAAELAGLQVEIEATIFSYNTLNVSAIQVELVSEGTAPPKVPDPIPVTIDYRPYRSSNPLNYRSRGKVRVVIFGSADVDVRQIDRESVLLAGVAPVRDHVRKIYNRTDRARDEYEDLVLMFKAQQVIKALEKSLDKELKNGNEVIL